MPLLAAPVDASIAPSVSAAAADVGINHAVHFSILAAASAIAIMSTPLVSAVMGGVALAAAVVAVIPPTASAAGTTHKLLKVPMRTVLHCMCSWREQCKHALH